MKPTRKILYLALGAVLSISFLFYIVNGKTEETVVLPGLTRAETELFTKDTDSDGLKDWEEELWKTDVFNADTDGDGTKDAEEIRGGRNPLVKGPSDPLDAETIENKVNKVTESDLSETDKLSRMLFAAYIGSKKTGDTSVEAFQEFLSDTLVDKSKDVPVRRFTYDDLKVASSENRESIRRYGNIVAELLTRPPKEPLEHELLIIDRAAKNDDESELLKLVPLIAEYRRIRDNLLVVEVPPSAVEHHLTLVLATEGLVQSLEGMRLIFSDPVRSMPLVGLYPDASEKFIVTIGTLGEYFIAKKVSFKQGEDGYKLFEGL